MEAVVEEGAGDAAGRKGTGAERHCSSCAARLPASSTRAHVLQRTSNSPLSSSSPAGSPISSTGTTEVRSVSSIVAWAQQKGLYQRPNSVTTARVGCNAGVRVESLGHRSQPTCIRSAAASIVAASSRALLHDGPSCIMAARVLHFSSSSSFRAVQGDALLLVAPLQVLSRLKSAGYK